MSDFLMNFLANLTADALIAIVVYIAITQRSEKGAVEARIKQALGLLKAELETNAARARNHIEKIELSQGQDVKVHFPLRYTRGAWNALKESGFLPLLRDAHLVYYLLRANEATVVANRSLCKFQDAVLTNNGNFGLLAEKAVQDSKRLIEGLDAVLSVLNQMSLPGFSRDELYETD